jgi:hypothetical protein
MISLDLSKCYGFEKHRSGLGYCINSLKPYHSKSGIFFDGFLEHNFSWHIRKYIHEGFDSIPYTFPWVGVIHNPPNPPDWYDVYNSPKAMFDRDVFQYSLRFCKAIICLSDYLANWVRGVCDTPVISVKHPTQTNCKKWEPIRFIKSERPKILQVGYWLRRPESICSLKSPYPYSKKWLPSENEYSLQMLNAYNKTDTRFFDDRHKWAGVEILDWLPHEEYDDILTSGIVFLDLYDSSANNAIIECIARNTPLLVNKHPAVVEYCGEDYPLYFDNLDHASDILHDRELIISAHEYFKNMDKSWLNGGYFASDVVAKLGEVTNGR